MASPCKQSMRRGRLLFEMLEEEQEPFLLDVYLLENGHSERTPRSQATFLCWPGSSNTCRFLPRLSSIVSKRRRGRILRCALAKLARWKLISKGLHWAPKNGWLNVFSCFPSNPMDSKNHVMAFQRLYCSSGLSEGAPDEGILSEIREDKEQLSPVSVLELHSDGGLAVRGHSVAVEVENPSTSSVSPTAEASDMFEELLACPHFPPLTQCAETKKEWLQTEKLLLECVKEMEDRIWGSKQRITQLIGLDFLDFRRDWSHFQTEMREVGREIEGAIFEEIREEAVRDMLGSHYTLERC